MESIHILLLLYFSFLLITSPGHVYAHRDRLKGLKIVSIDYPTSRKLYARHQTDESDPDGKHAPVESGYPDSLRLEFTAFGRHFRLDLSKSQHLFPESGILRVTSDGMTETRFMDGFYQGHVYDKDVSSAVGWVRVHIDDIQAASSGQGLGQGVGQVRMDGTMTLDETGSLYNLQKVSAHVNAWHPHVHANVARGYDLFSDPKMCYMQKLRDQQNASHMRSKVQVKGLVGSPGSIEGGNDDNDDSDDGGDGNEEEVEAEKAYEHDLELVKVESIPLSCGHDSLQFNMRANGAPSTHARSISAHHARLPSRYFGNPLLAADELAVSDGLDWASTMTVINISSQLPSLEHAPLTPRTRRRQVASNSSGSSTNPLLDIVPLEGASCPATLKVLYMGVAADCAYSAAYENNVAAIESSILKMWNVISGIYQYSFNIQLGIVNLHIMKNCSTDAEIAADHLGWNRACQANYNISDKLNDFSRWRGTTQSTDAGLWHLVSGCPSANVIGIAWLNQLCNVKTFQPLNSADFVSGTGVTSIIDNMYAVIAHEIGHNFGAIHDCVRETCVGCASDVSTCACCPCGTGSGCDCRSQFIMNPESGGLSPTKFSPCSTRDICGKLPYFGKCLQEPGSKKVILGNVCGNGIKEAGEQCDCGNSTQCEASPCCFGNCTLRPGASCSDNNDACCSKCAFIPASANHSCLSSADPCQLTSYCSGNSSDCPARSTLKDGTDCPLALSASYDRLTDEAGNGTGKCASGLCTSRDLQCRLVGKRNSIVGACPDSSFSGQCEMYCQSGASSGYCVYLDATFIDGTPCYGGLCYGGVCNADAIHKLGYWFSQNAVLAIVVGSALGLIILISLLLYFMRRKKAAHRRHNLIQLRRINPIPSHPTAY